MTRATRGRWARVPLHTRLVAITTVLLGVGLLVAGLTTTNLLGRYLVGQLDQRLVSEGRDLAQDSADHLAQACSAVDSALPSDYVVVLSFVDGSQCPLGRTTTYQRHGTPALPTLSTGAAAAIAGAPFTVGSSLRDSPWRVVVYPLYPDAGGPAVGIVAVSLPMDDIQQTIHRAGILMASAGIVIVGVGILAGEWAVRRSLRPLREIEDTAAAIAAGDLSRRVPAAPESTEVGRLGVALNGMLSQIEQAFADRTASEARMRRFVADASHELRTPLAAIRGYGELYRMGALTTKEQVDDTLRRIEDSATRMGGLVQELLALARLDEGRPPRAEPVDLTVLAADALADLHALDPARPVRVRALDSDEAPRRCMVTGDEGALRQVFANLVGNVHQHTPADTPAEIAVGARDGRAVIEVRDHGPGISPEHAGRVFERFYRVDSSRSRAAGHGGGAGLGMAIVAGVVAAHDGTVVLATTPGGGTTVQVTLPLSG